MPSSLSLSEIHNLNQAVLTIHRTRGPEEFSENLLTAMRQILAVDICVVDWYGFRGLPVHTVFDPVHAVPMSVNERLHLHSHQNPVYERARGSVATISDFLSATKWHRTDLYREGYSAVGQEDGLMLDVELRPDCRLNLITSRGRRGFTVEERTLLHLLEPHVREAFTRLELQDRVQKDLRPTPSEEKARTRLTERQREVLLWLSSGKTNDEIARLLGVSPGTVKRHLEDIYTRLGVDNRHAAALIALRLMA